jgi:polar amino acid transport system substrate-binding protein
MTKKPLNLMLTLKQLRQASYLLLLLTCNQYTWSDKHTQLLQIRTIAVSPYGIEAPEGDSGIYFDLANTLVQQLTADTHFLLDHKIYPYVRIIHELKTGQTDLSIMFKYKELEDYVTYIHPLPTLTNIVIGLSGTEFKNIAELEGKTLAYLRGAKFSDAIDNNPLILKITTKDFRQGIDLLKAGRVDAIIGPSEPIIAAAQKFDDSEQFFGLPLAVSERTPWVQISNKSPLMAIIPQIKQHIKYIIEKGELETLREFYLSHHRHIIE